MRDRRTAVIFDADGTLWDVSSIRHFVTPPITPDPNWRRDFHAFHQASIACPANSSAIKEWHRAGLEGHLRILVTAREARWFNETLWWMFLNPAIGAPDDMFMRRWNDFRPDDVIKQELFMQFIAPRYNVVRAVDDNPSVIQVWEDLGVPEVITIPGWN